MKGWKWARELPVQIGIIAAAFDHLDDRFAVAVLFNARCLVEIGLKAKGNDGQQIIFGKTIIKGAAVAIYKSIIARGRRMKLRRSFLFHSFRLGPR